MNNFLVRSFLLLAVLINPLAFSIEDTLSDRSNFTIENEHELYTAYASGYGEISEKTGRPKTVHVNGYYRKDGTYVKPHYRSSPRSV